MTDLSQAKTTDTTPKVTCFHDGECPICNIEINAMKKLDKAGNIHWVDITQDKAALAKAGLTYKQAMDRMHVIDENQQLQSGVSGFLQVWKLLPYYRRAVPIIQNVPLLLPLMEFCYRIFARYRLPLTGKKQLKE
jgi:predicted DCC family thiol-disulfide oxidoreductase YuxK